MKATLFILSFFLTASTAMAQSDELITPDIEKALQKSNEEMVNSVNEMNKTFEEVIPQITKSVENMMGNFLNSITPVIESIEKNQTLTKASKKISQEFQNTVQEKPLSNYLSVQGSKADNGQSIEFNFNQDPEVVSQTNNLITQKSDRKSVV